MIYHRETKEDLYQFLPAAWITRSMRGNLWRVWAFGRYREFGWKPFVWARPVATKEEERAFWSPPLKDPGPPRCKECGEIVGSPKCLHAQERIP